MVPRALSGCGGVFFHFKTLDPMTRLVEFVGNHPILFLALALVIGMLVFFEYQRAFSGVKIISPMEATRLQNDEEAIFLDIREEAEYKIGHIMGNVHIPLSNFPKRMVELDKYKDQPVIVYCTSGQSCLLYTSPSPRDRG